MNKFLDRCATCKIYIPQQQTCQLMPSLQGKIKPDDFCSQYKRELPICEICHRGTLEPILRYENNQVHIYCINCYQTI